MKKNIIVDRKDKKKVSNLLIMSNNSDRDSKNKLRLLKLINFSFFIKEVILNDLKN